MEYDDARRVWLAWMQGTLQGPRAGEDEELARSPLDCYCSGILAPAATKGQSAPVTNADDHQELPTGVDREGEGEPVEMGSAGLGENTCADMPPAASFGLSFLVTSDVHLEVLVQGAMYDRERAGNLGGGQTRPRWRRKRFATVPSECEFRPPSQSATETRPILGGRADVVVRWRNHNDNWLVTVALVNRVATGGGPRFAEELAKACFFQTRVACVPLRGRILPYPRLEGLKLTEEEEELELQYRDKKVFAIGHGAAADWTVDGHGYVTELAACFLPAVEVPLVTTQNSDLPERSLDLAFLANCDKRPDEVIDQLDEFVDRYAVWVETERDGHRSNDSSANDISTRITERQRCAVERMRRGCELLRTDDKARHAFSLAQDAMRQQMIHVRLVQGQETDNLVFKWRPFQLAFLLLAIESVVNPDSAERDLVDLLWFPTGGGKTEAYLALIAVLVVYRRLRWPGSGGGTAVIMRYTLRLLTAQQFQRATALICALEIIRRKAPREELGNEPITGGLWVGAASTPNRNEEAVSILAELEAGQQGSRGLFLDRCPWCGMRLVPSPEDCHNRRGFGIRRQGNGIEFFCPKKECEFHDRLPFHVVDEHLYEHPPTLLLATVDKFARLTWEDRASVLFGAAPNRPPEMIIQDELHLIAGPLGSFAGLYEAAISTVLSFKGICPKYIASTATIRNASQQVRALYGRAMAVFPPPGHSCDDSYFARTDGNRPGRLYVGLCGQSPFLNWRETLAVAAAAALAVPIAKQWQGLLKDAWWTSVIYHGSLRGVGQSHRLALHDIPDTLNRILAEEQESSGTEYTDGQTAAPTRTVRELHLPGQVLELTSHIDGAGIQEVLRRLEKPCDDPESVSIVLCTNMLSVGIDISRLALMIVNGQPLATAEYIQASSRVGRDRVPGIVVVNYNRQPRDLSHFENFRPYHESFYRFVEPTSVTPFSAPARHLALHAALVILMRHGIGLLANDDAFRMDPNDGSVRKILRLFLDRCQQADPESIGEVEEQAARLLSEWRAQAEDHNTLLYQRRPNEPMFAALLRNIFEPPENGIWETMQSMRSVDRVSDIRVVGPHKPGGAGGFHAGN